jgi:hypothetical protein
MSTISPDPVRLDYVQALARRILSQTTIDRYAPAFAKMYSDPDRRAQAWHALLDREKRQLELIATSVSRPEPERAHAQTKLALFESPLVLLDVEQEIAQTRDGAGDACPAPPHADTIQRSNGVATSAHEPRAHSEESSTPRARKVKDRGVRPIAGRAGYRGRSAATVDLSDDVPQTLDVVPLPGGPSDAFSQGWLTRKYSTPDAIFDPRLELDGLTRLVYVYLCGRAGRNGEAGPTMLRIARETGISDRKVRQAVAALTRAGLIEHRPRTHSFRILDPEAWPAPATTTPAAAPDAAAVAVSAESTTAAALSAPHADRSARGAV